MSIPTDYKGLTLANIENMTSREYKVYQDYIYTDKATGEQKELYNDYVMCVMLSGKGLDIF